MGEAKCPACRRRFPVDAESVECIRCGADLSLLINLRKHAGRLVSDALSDPFVEPGERIERLKKAQFVCRAPEVQWLIDSLLSETTRHSTKQNTQRIWNPEFGSGRNSTFR